MDNNRKKTSQMSPGNPFRESAKDASPLASKQITVTVFVIAVNNTSDYCNAQVRLSHKRYHSEISDDKTPDSITPHRGA